MGRLNCMRMTRLIKNRLRPYYHKLRYERFFNQLRQPKRKGDVRMTPETCAQIRTELQAADYTLRDLEILLNEYRRYLVWADYRQYADYYAGPGRHNYGEKSLEHYIAWELLDLQPDDVYIDIANDHSPTPEIYSALSKCRSYRQDLIFEPGLHGDRIGGDAANMPVPDGFASKMALHCSFEHFEGDADIRFIAECRRVLRPGGRVCILPLYLHTEYAIQLDPLVYTRARPEFEPDATLHCARGYANRHGRFYDVAHLTERIRNHCDGLRLTIYDLQNAGEVSPLCYVKFVMLLEKP